MTRTPINLRASLAFLHDVCAAALAWSLLYWLRFSLDLPQPYLADLGQTLAWIVPLQAGIFIALGLYRGLWRFASLVDLQRIVLAAALGAVVVPVVLVMLQLQAVVPPGACEVIRSHMILVRRSRRIREPSFSHKRPRLGCLRGTLRPSRLQMRSTIPSPATLGWSSSCAP